MKATNLLGHKNQFLITDGNIYYFQSYDTLICKVVQGDLEDNLTILNNYWSSTTGRHMKAFLENTHMLYIVLDLIHKHKVFNSLKDFMERTQKLKLFKGVVTMEYKNNQGEIITFTCKA